jgi:hypothetical protein
VNVLHASVLKPGTAVLCVLGMTLSMQGQTAGPRLDVAATQVGAAVQFDMPKSHNPLSAYAPEYVPEAMLANSPRLDRLTRDGKLYLSLRDAIDLALENNLDLAIARYNLPIANTDILRTQA